MKIMSKVLIFLPITLFHCKAQALSSNSFPEEIAKDTTYVLTVNDTMPIFSFHYTAYHDEELKIVVSNPKTGDVIQTIEDDFDVSPDQYEGLEPLWMMDLNYDGYGDLVILTGMQPILGSRIYSYWLYNPRIGCFERDENMCANLNEEPEFDLDKRTVKTFSVQYPMTFNRDSKTYRFISGSYVLIRRLKCDVHASQGSKDDSEWIWSLEELINGKLTIVKKHVGSDIPDWAKELE